MSTTIYGIIASPPVRTVLYTAKLIGRPAELKQVNLMAGDHLKPEFLKMNPLHTVPTIDDEGNYLFESNAIIGYLADKYAKDDSLYPKDPYTRAVIHQRLFINHLLFARMRDRITPLRPGGDGILKPETLTKIQQELDNLETLLADNQWMAGTDSPSIADIALLTSFDNMEVLMADELSSRPKLQAWLKRSRTYAEANIDTYRETTEEAKAFIIQFFSSKPSK